MTDNRVIYKIQVDVNYPCEINVNYPCEIGDGIHLRDILPDCQYTEICRVAEINTTYYKPYIPIDLKLVKVVI